MVALDASGHILTNHSDEVGAVELPDLRMDIFDHSVNQSAARMDVARQARGGKFGRAHPRPERDGGERGSRPQRG